MQRIALFATILAAFFTAAPAWADSPNIVSNLSVFPAVATRSCPVVFTFKGIITTNNWPQGADRRVQYMFLRSDNAAGALRSVSFPATAGGSSREVSTSWTLGKTYEGWESMQIISPRRLASNRASFRLSCNAKNKRTTRKNRFSRVP